MGFASYFDRDADVDDDVVDKIQGEIEDEDGAETDKVGEEIDASADTKETHEISAQDALKAITTLQTFFMQKKLHLRFNIQRVTKQNELIKTYQKNKKK